MSTEIENKELEVFGTKEVSVKEFMGSSSKSLVLLSDYEKAKENLYELKEKYQDRVEELVSIEKLSADELKELNSIRSELREPRYLIQNIEKNNISVFEAYKKTDKANLKGLIEINNSLEDKATEKLKVEEQRKKDEKEAEAKADELRISKIKLDIDNIEIYCSEIIQKMTFENMKVSVKSVEQSLYAEYEFEEYDILFDQVKNRVTKLLADKTIDITERENQRLENEAMKQEIFQVRVNRLKEVGYELNNGIFKSEIFDDGITESFILDCNSISFEKTLGDIKNAISANEQAKRDAEIQKEKNDEFDVRKNRLFEIGFNITDNLHFMFCKEFPDISINTDSIFKASLREFEQILLDAKTSITKAKEQKELAEKQKEEFEKKAIADKKKADAENKARVKRLATDKKIISDSLEVYFADLHLETDNKETKDFIEVANSKIQQLKSDLLTQLNEL